MALLEINRGEKPNDEIYVLSQGSQIEKEYEKASRQVSRRRRRYPRNLEYGGGRNELSMPSVAAGGKLSPMLSGD